MERVSPTVGGNQLDRTVKSLTQNRSFFGKGGRSDVTTSDVLVDWRWDSGGGDHQPGNRHHLELSEDRLGGVGETIRDATPIAFDLQRLHVAIKELEPEIRQNQKVVAQLEVEIEFQEKQVAKLKEEQDKALAEMRKLRQTLGESKSEFQFAGRTYTRPEIEQDLRRRMDVYQERDSELKAKEQLLENQRQTLAAARRKASEYRRQYDQLVAKAEALQAELKLLEAAQATSTAQIDDSKLGEVKALAQEVEKRIRVGQRMLDAERKPLAGEIPVDMDDRPVTERFDELFAPKPTSQPADSKQT